MPIDTAVTDSTPAPATRPPLGSEGKGDARHLLRYASLIGPLGAVAQVGYGWREMRNATDPTHRLNARIDVTTGIVRGISSSMTYGAAIAALTGFATVSNAIYACAGFHAASILLDAGRDIYNHTRSGDRSDLRSGALKLTSLAVMAAGFAMGSPATIVAGSYLSDAVILVQNRVAMGAAVRGAVGAVRKRFSPGEAAA